MVNMRVCVGLEDSFMTWRCCVQPCATLWTVATRPFCPWDFPGKNTGVGCHPFLQGIFLTQVSNPHLLSHLYWHRGLQVFSPILKVAFLLCLTLSFAVYIFSLMYSQLSNFVFVACAYRVISMKSLISTVS